MSDSSRTASVARRPVEDRLDSWKEIATFLGREVRTVQTWEKNERLPVHRHQHSRQGSVFALKSELDAWLEARKVTGATPLPTAPVKPPPWILLLVAASVTVVAIAGWLIWKHGAANPAENISSVVVLPFLDLSPQKDQEYFSDGLTEEIIDGLSRVPNLRVVARTSAFTFKGKANDIRQIGRQLNVGTVLEGSVRKSGNQLRITAQLNRASDGYHLWSQTYDRQLRDVFAVQRDISQAIANQLRAGEVPQREPTSDLEAYRLYQEGRYFFNKHEPPESYRKAIERYQKAVQRDQIFSLAYAGLADAWAYLAEMHTGPARAFMPKAKEAALQAVELDENLAEAHTSLGIVKLDYDWDIEGGQRELRSAMALNPGSGYVHHWYAHSLEAQNRLEEATKEMRASLELDPLSVIIWSDIGMELIAAKKYDETLQHADKCLELFGSTDLSSLSMKAEAYYRKGDKAAAHQIFERIKAAHPELSQDPSFIAGSALDAARDGRRAEALGILDRLERLRQTQYVQPFLVIQLCAELRDHKRLMVWLQRAYEDRDGLFPYTHLLKDVFFAGDPEAEAWVARRL